MELDRAMKFARSDAREAWINVYQNILSGSRWQGCNYYSGRDDGVANGFDVIILYRIHVRLK